MTKGGWLIGEGCAKILRLLADGVQAGEYLVKDLSPQIVAAAIYPEAARRRTKLDRGAKRRGTGIMLSTGGTLAKLAKHGYAKVKDLGKDGRHYSITKKGRDALERFEKRQRTKQVAREMIARGGEG